MLSLVSAVTSAAAIPSGAPTAAQKLGTDCEQVTVLVEAVCTAGQTMTCKVVLWAYYPEAAAWYAFKALNAGADIAETSADVIAYAEAVTGLGKASAIHPQVTAVAGTGTSVTVKAITGLRRS